MLKPYLLSFSLCALPLASYAQTFLTTQQIVDQYAQHMFSNSHAIGMTVVVIDGKQVQQRYFGETQYGNDTRPQANTLIRIASLSKLMTSEVMVALADDGTLKLNDPLQKYAPLGFSVPRAKNQAPITLLNLATHTSGLPREQPGSKPPDTPVFTWPTQSQRWQWLAQSKMSTPPGTRAAYSNLAYDFLADALSHAAHKPYSTLLREKITDPLGMQDTTLTPSAAQCARLMQGVGASPCGDARAASGSGGVYSTPGDMQRWMQAFLTPSTGPRKALAQQAQALYFQRSALRSLKGMDIVGQADALGLGWVYMAPRQGLPAILQKTGRGGGANTYIAMIPQHGIGVFVALTRSERTRFHAMSDGANQLLAALLEHSRQ